MTVLLPSADVSNTGWTATGRSSLWECLQEGTGAPDDDLTYVLSATAGDVFVVQLASGTAPGGTAIHTVSVRARTSGGVGTAQPQVLVELLETATVRGSTTIQTTRGFPFAWQTFAFTASGIGVYTDLRLRVTVSSLTGTQRVRVSAAQLEYAPAVTYGPRGKLAQPGAEAGSVTSAGVERGTMTPCT